MMPCLIKKNGADDQKSKFTSVKMLKECAILLPLSCVLMTYTLLQAPAPNLDIRVHAPI